MTQLSHDTTSAKYLELVFALSNVVYAFLQMIGRQDPYVKLWVGRAGTKVKTKVHEDGGKVATWNESFMFDLKVCVVILVFFVLCTTRHNMPLGF